ncbi:hypothetical protein H6G89_13835 [Oscillatoria sp. FACHB-1407]|uniref:hypothetical protein n=1 Tax=Oscillatoria sp. FACHB-1407 TaxID=2692847 RepID=UPI001684077F|nr:hypothetical protein [Oscillatoria sp. FACHB-1407]MBD2462128.1 hypothetical protein [Oscillatoria sp. FACHB-1407]
MDDWIGFTPREKYILNAYRDRDLLNSSRYITLELIYIIPSMLFVSFYFLEQNATWVFVGYFLLLLRLYLITRETLLFLRPFRSIFAKYEAKIKELKEVVEAQQPPAS